METQGKGRQSLTLPPPFRKTRPAPYDIERGGGVGALEASRTGRPDRWPPGRCPFRDPRRIRGLRRPRRIRGLGRPRRIRRLGRPRRAGRAAGGVEGPPRTADQDQRQRRSSIFLLGPSICHGRVAGRTRETRGKVNNGI